MSWIKGFDFRDTEPFVTSVAPNTYVINGDTYPVTRNGVTFGDEVGGAAQPRDRNAGINPSLAGCWFVDPPSLVTFRVDLIDPGEYIINGAFGDASESRTNAIVRVYDDLTLLFSIDHTSGFTTSENLWRDATDNLRSDTTWPGSNASRTETFATTTLRVVLGDGVSRFGFIAHLRVEQVQSQNARSRMLLGVGA